LRPTPQASSAKGAITRQGLGNPLTVEDQAMEQVVLTDDAGWRDNGTATAVQGVLHHRGRVREAPLHQKQRERYWHGDSPKGGDWQRRGQAFGDALVKEHRQ
jgi:hypothetical protein